MSASAARLPDGRLHFHHGPMDLIIGAWGPEAAVRAAYARAWERFAPLLDELVAELPALRASDGRRVTGPAARAMLAAIRPFHPTFITPMAAVAGAVADRVLSALAGEGVAKAYVNNGGDIALYLTEGQSLTAAIAARSGLPDRVIIRHADPVRGLATSGWRGRSFSLGIADAATVLAPTAAMADAAATMIANAVDLPGHPAVSRTPAERIKADSDLGHRPVTVQVGPLDPTDRACALDAGLAAAQSARNRGLIHAAALFLQGEHRLLDIPDTAFHLGKNTSGGPGGSAPRRIAAKGGKTPFRKEQLLV